MRLSSEMFPFASHAELGYTLEFAAKELAEVGKVVMKYGHRVTMHPGQFTQLGSPKENVVVASTRDLEYHAELIDLLDLKGQIDRDAVMILHMGYFIHILSSRSGMFGDKEATLARFKENYLNLSDRVKKRLVLENDDMCWSVEDLLPTCQDLGIPMVLVLSL
jgi:UV DNA damage endonuclease